MNQTLEETRTKKGFFVTHPILTYLYKGLRVGPFSSSRNARLWRKGMVGVFLRVQDYDTWDPWVTVRRPLVLQAEFEVLFHYREDRSLKYDEIDVPY